MTDTALPLAIALVRSLEGCNLTAYPDDASGGKPYTIGWGTILLNGNPVQPGQVITQAVADAAQVAEVTYSLGVARRAVLAVITDGEAAALTSFAYNLGAGALRTSTLVKLVSAGNRNGAVNEFRKWIYGAGRPMLGLLRRRWVEAAVFSGSALSPVVLKHHADTQITGLGQWPKLPE
jgi:lysozyme